VAAQSGDLLRLAPEIVTQLDGTVDRAIVTALVQAYHWYVKVGVGKPLQVPLAAVSVLPAAAVPLIAGL
jgi:hypothetical protein